MIRLHDIKHSLTAGFHGVQEAILEVAEKVNLKVKETKMFLEIRDLENEIDSSHARLGKAIFQLRGQNSSTLYENPEINKILNSCRALHEKVSRLREKHQSIDENGLDGQVNLLHQLLEKQNLKFIRLTIGKTSPLKGSKIKDLKLSPDVLILCVLKKNRLMIANGDTRIDDQDHIFVMGPEPQIDQLKERNLSYPQ